MPRSVAARIEDEEELFHAAVPAEGLRSAGKKVHTREVGREKARAKPVAASAPAARSVEERLGVLEAATDLAELRSEIRLNRWVQALVATALVGIMGLLFTFHNSTNARIDQTNARLDSVIEKMDMRFDQTNARFDQINARLDQTNARLDSAVSELRAEIRATNERLDARFDALMAEIRELRRDRTRD